MYNVCYENIQNNNLHLKLLKDLYIYFELQHKIIYASA